MDADLPTYSYRGLEELGDTPHIVVDGAQRAGTALVLSHWPASPTPEILWRDLSSEIAHAYLLHREFWARSATLVTNDHPDIDGLISLCFLTNPNFATDHAELLHDVARAGDFGVIRSRRAAQIAWAIQELMHDPDLAAAGLSDAEVSRASTMTINYRSLLAALPRIVATTASYESLYRTHEERFDQTAAQIVSGELAFREYNDVELAVFYADHHLLPVDEDLVGRDLLNAFDPWALHSATGMSRILVGVGQRFVLYDRYETWVRFVSHRHQLRRDHAALAISLSGGDRTVWTADAPGAIEPVMWHDDQSSVRDAGEVINLVIDHLASAPAAWDPFRPQGPPMLSGATSAVSS